MPGSKTRSKVPMTRRSSIQHVLLILFVLSIFTSCENNKQKTERFPPDTVPLTSKPVENFALLDSEGRFQELYYYSDQRAVALIVQGNGCPIIRQNIPYLNELQKEYASRGITFLMVNSNPQDDRPAIAKEAQEYNLSIPILKDSSQLVAESLDLTRTAEVLLVRTSDWRIIYRGAISDQFDYDSKDSQPDHQYLKDAIDAYLANGKITVASPLVKGCLINRESQPSTPATFTSDIAPILETSCLPCHKPGGVGPFSMESYAKVKGWGPMIREVVRTRRMPPWHADPLYGEFTDDLSLSALEASTLVHWIEQNYNYGEGEDPLPELIKSVEGQWSLGAPDLVFKLKERQTIPANGKDEYRFIEADRLVAEDMWVRAIDIVPQSKPVVHHCNLAVEWPAGQKAGDDNATDTELTADMEEWYRLSGYSMETGAVIAGYSPGSGPFVLPEDAGIFIPKGSRLIFRMHYITTGKAQEDLTQAGIYLHKAKPSKIFSVGTITNRAIRIPAGEKNYLRSGTFEFKEDVVLTAIQPHMHYRGKSMKFTLVTPDGKEEVLLSVPRYRFQWQRRYTLKNPRSIPAGSKIIAEGYYDNSAQNPGNPDPTKEVLYGPHSQAEMFTGILYYMVEENDQSL